MRILVVFLSLDRSPWSDLEAVQRETWAVAREGIEFAYLQGYSRGFLRLVFLAWRRVAEKLGLRSAFDIFFGRIFTSLPMWRRGNVVRVPAPEYWIGTSAKTRAGFRYFVKEYEFDYVVRTNSSTYIHLPSLVAKLQSAPRSLYYAGADQGKQHAQGTCIILSRDVVEEFAADRSWNYEIVDDEAVGSAAQRLAINCELLPQRKIVEPSESVQPRDLSTEFIFRFKTRGHREEDMKNMREMHEFVNKSPRIVDNG